MATILILSGIPCSGKTTHAKSFLINSPETVLLSRDAFRKKYNLYDYSPESESKVAEYYSQKLHTVINDPAVDFIIIDNTHCSNKELQSLINQIETCDVKGHYIILEFFDCSLFKAMYRNIKRWIYTSKWTPFSFIYNSYKRYKKIDQDYYNLYLL
jgi:tRNA uridine 5-carbamoylmethylation protein Kti12